MTKMNFYKLIEQQYKDYKSKYGILPPSCDGCPCKSIRHKLINQNEREDCTGDIMYLANKYKIDVVEAYTCDGCAFTAVEIAKKYLEKKSLIKYK